MPKRPFDAVGGNHHGQAYKKYNQGHGNRKHSSHTHSDERTLNPKSNKSSISYEEALKQLPPEKVAFGPVPSFTPFTVAPGLPDLPPVEEGPLSTAIFRHKSTVTYDRSTVDATRGDVSYERLEFLGDTYIELIASRLIFSRFSHLPAGQMSQLRELLVKNETLCEYGCAYGFDRRVHAHDLTRLSAAPSSSPLTATTTTTTTPGNKGFQKIVGDVFEAYVAAVVLSSPDEGFATAEKWLTALWAPKLLAAAARDRFYRPEIALVHAADADRRTVYDATAKATLQRRILWNQAVTLAYEPYQASVELKGAQLGQNRHFIAVYLTGYGYERKELGRGEGKNKVEAGNWAAIEALYGECKGVVDECEEKMVAAKAAKAAARASKLEEDVASAGAEGRTPST